MFGWLAGLNPMAAVGAVTTMGGSILDYYGQQDTNETNVAIADGTNAFNAEQAQIQRDWSSEQAKGLRDWQENLANTAYQRSRVDMEKAGLNPMLMASQGGAATPSGAMGSGQAASGVTTRVENAVGKLGQGLASLAPTALAMMKGQKELENLDAQNAGIKAAALASVAQANNANASAKATQASMPSVEARARSASYEADAAIAEGRARKRKGDIDTSAAGYDAVVQRVLQLIQGAGAASSIFKNLEQMKSSAQRNHEFLDKQGTKGMRVP